jgi:uncharacterized protein YbjT (DUF2867 family)
MPLALVAGASGRLGSEVLASLDKRQWRTRALCRDPSKLKGPPGHEAHKGDLLDTGSLEGACRGVDVVFSCVGASLSLSRQPPERTFTEVDLRGTLNLLESAKSAGVRRFVYVSVYGAERFPALEYCRAHHEAAEAVRASGLEQCVIEPTGFFSTMEELLKMARLGQGVVIGNGGARSNPIAEPDLAEICTDAITARQIYETTVAAGGPDALTRREMVELAFIALGRAPRVRRVPRWTVDVAAGCLGPFSRRRSALISFLAMVSTTDLVAPALGQRKLADHYKSIVAKN